LLADTSTSNKTLASSTNSNDSILEGKELLQRLFSVVKDCRHCTAKLKNLAGVDETPSQQDNSQRYNNPAPARKLYQDD
jgi:hypothetical protein